MTLTIFLGLGRLALIQGWRAPASKLLESAVKQCVCREWWFARRCENLGMTENGPPHVGPSALTQPSEMAAEAPPAIISVVPQLTWSF